MAKETRTTGATASGRRTSAVSKAAKVAAKPARTVAKAAAAAKRVVKPAKVAPKKNAKPAAKTASKATKSRKLPAAKPSKPAKSAAKATKAPPKKAAPVKAAAKKAPAKAPAKAAAKAPAKKVTTKAPVKAKANEKAPAPAKKPVAVKPAKPALVPKPAPSRPVLSEVVARKHRTPAVAASTMERLKVLLLEELGHHTRQAEGLLADADALANEREPGDTQFDEESGEGDTLSVERERDLALSNAARQTVDEIEKALARMEDGTYGYCEVCGDRIPVPRLEAIPWADQCVKCKSRGERRR